MNNDFLVEMNHIDKSFGGVHALKDVSFSIKKAEIRALVGENGAGKSTLIKVLSGVIGKDSGTVAVDGKELRTITPKLAMDNGIAVVYQEFMLAPALTVAENIFIDNLTGGKKLLHWSELYSNAGKLLASIGFPNIDPRVRVNQLSVAYQQVVEICKALSRGAKILILDEPTAVLTTSEIKSLFELIKKLKDQGVSTVFVSHRLEEIYELCESITVMRDGETVGTYSVEELNKNQLVEKMVGRTMENMYPPKKARSLGQVALKAEHICQPPAVKDVSFEVREGEILGFSGLVGAGRTETMRALFGADRLQSGNVYYFGKNVFFKSPNEAVKNGLGMVSEDRKTQGVVLKQSLRVNATLSALGSVLNRLGIIDYRKESGIVEKLLEELKTKYYSIEDNVETLSGGNQQKVSVSKWLASDCRVIILDEPTRGVDVGAKYEIYSIISALADKGIAVIVVSSEMNELIGICDRIIAIREGLVTGELSAKEMSENNLIKLIMGVA